MEKARLTAAEQTTVVRAMREVAADRVPERRPMPARWGMRWADVQRAVAAACDDIEAAVIRTVEDPDGNGYRFLLRTIEEWPGEITVRRVDGPEVYRAEARIGWFPDDPARAERADALLVALRRQMRAYGAKRAMDEP